MEKIGRVVIVGILAGLVLSAAGTVAHLVLTPFAAGVKEGLLRESPPWQLVLLGFGADLVRGFFYDLVFAILRPALGAAWVKRFLLFWLTLILLGVVPRAVGEYGYFNLPDRFMLASAVAWALEAMLAALVIALLFAKAKDKPGSTQ